MGAMERMRPLMGRVSNSGNRLALLLLLTSALLAPPPREAPPSAGF